MELSVVRYKIKPDRADENERLMRGIFDELEATESEGVRILSLRLDDGTFIHIAEIAEGATPVSKLHAFEAYHAQLHERCLEPPTPCDATIVGDYRMLGSQRVS